MQILLVEDEEAIRDFVEDCLAENGHEVSAVANGNDALEVIGSRSGLDLLISDFNLGGTVDGVEIAERFCASHSDAAVLMISGHPDLARPKLANAKYVGLLSKPFRISDLLLAVERTMSLRH